MERVGDGDVEGNAWTQRRLAVVVDDSRRRRRTTAVEDSGGGCILLWHTNLWDVVRGKMLILIFTAMKCICSYNKIWAASWAADCKICSPNKLKFCSGRMWGRMLAATTNINLNF
jgi:hypothetical protein